MSATFRIVWDVALMREVPTDADGFLDLMVERHRVLMAGRERCVPGSSSTGRTTPAARRSSPPACWSARCAPRGKHIDAVVDPFHRAVMTMFVVTECHPFDDGNGRVARILTNAELVAHDQARIVVTNCYRGNYLAGLTAASANGNGAAARRGARLHPPLGRCGRLVRLGPVHGRPHVVERLHRLRRGGAVG